MTIPKTKVNYVDGRALGLWTKEQIVQRCLDEAGDDPIQAIRLARRYAFGKNTQAEIMHAIGDRLFARWRRELAR